MSWGGVHFAKLPLIASLRWHFPFVLVRWVVLYCPEWDYFSPVESGKPHCTSAEGICSWRAFGRDLCYGLSCVPTTPPAKIIHMLKA